jgi:hypothetical protein
MQSKLYISYKWPNTRNDSDIDLKSLWRSLMGFDSTIERLLRIAHIKGDIEIKATKIGHGSFEVEVLIFFLQHIPFNSVDDLVKLIQFCDLELFHQLTNLRNKSFGDIALATQQLTLQDILNEIVNIRKSYNKVLAENPDINSIVSWLIGAWITKFFSRGGKVKESPKTHDPILWEIPSEYAIWLHKMIKNKWFHKALRPFIDQEFDEVKIYTDKTRETAKAVIDWSNFDKYLSGLSEILPEFENGKKYWVTWTIVNYQSARWDSMKIQLDNIAKKNRLIILYPHDWTSTEDYIKYYKKNVSVYVEVVRRSMYQKPQLILHEVSLIQEKLI